MIKYIILLISIFFVTSCFVHKNLRNIDKKERIGKKNYVDSFDSRSPFYCFNNTLLTNKLDSLIKKAKIEQSEDFWDPRFPPYITIEPFLESDSIFFKFKIGKDYLLNFDPPNIQYSKKFFYGFGVAKYKSYLVRLNGIEANYTLNLGQKRVSLIEKTLDELKFQAFGLRILKDNSWIEPFHPFVRIYYFYEFGDFNHYLTEIKKK